ncbi:MAG TPA: SDR family NAD(P)-dependent oxidoreductase, partial [Longimicrobiales bacterium]|nr:SDR family NAD(P)-dependent oxidoreductase [Longimicrobiales bacterium]
GGVERRAQGSAAGPAGIPTGHPLLGDRIRTAGDERVFEVRLGGDRPAYLAGHRVHGQAVVPATAYMEMALAAGADVFGSDEVALEDLLLREPLVLPESGERVVQVVVSAPSGGRASFRVASLDGGGKDERWRVHATGSVAWAAGADDVANAPDMDTLRAAGADPVPVSSFYDALTSRGIEYRDAFRCVAEFYRREGEAYGRAALSDVAGSGYRIHPALLDGCLQILGGVMPSEGTTYLPFGIDRFRSFRPMPDRVRVHAILTDGGSGSGTLRGDVRVYSEAGEPVAVVEGVSLRPAGRLAVTPPSEIEPWLYEVSWVPAPVGDGATGDAAGSWLILGNADGLGGRLAEALERRGGRCVVSAEPGGPDALRALVEEAFSPESPVRGVVHLFALDEPPAAVAVASDSIAGLAAAQERVTGSVVHLVQALVSAGRSAKLWLVTRGAQAVAAGEAPNPHAATLWGLARVIREEHPELGCVSIDLDPSGDSSESDRLLTELLAADGEEQVALRAGSRLAARLVRYGAGGAGSTRVPGLPEDGRPFELYTEKPGVLDGLRFRPVTRRSPGPGEVEIEVVAVGLNFRDVLNALGEYPGGPIPLGIECAGVVTAVGEGVEGYSVGDAVMAFAPGSFRSHVVAPVEWVIHKPVGLSFVEAATIPSAFGTAWYTLYRLAGLRAGERVLIHAAAGGVGMAAVQLAQRAGAEIFATAGSPAKRALLRSLGVQHVMNSRTLDFAEEVKRITGGRGVDVVLNSLADEFIPRSLEVLAEDGRFIEIGKRGIWDPARVAEVKPRATYHVVDLGAALEQEPELIQELLKGLAAAFAAGELEPLPVRTFPMQNAVDAFRFMAQARHVGKIVLTSPTRPLGAGLRPDATYLITGGLGGLGLRVARWMVDHGARHLVLVGRRAPTEAAEAAVRELESAGARVAVLRADVSRVEDVDRVLAEIDRGMPPLRGVIHAAGEMDEAVLLRQDWLRFRRVFAPKVDGGWILHSRTRERALDFFVLYSSAAAILGPGGLANHAAACSFLDALAHRRRAEGLPALSIDWGQWADVGVAAERGVADRLAARGIGAMTSAQGIAAFERVLGDADAAPQVVVLPIDWGRRLERGDAPRFFSLVATESQRADGGRIGPSDEGAGRVGLKERLRDMPPARRAGELREFVRRQAAKVLGLASADRIDPRQPLQELGLDSLMVVELRNLLGSGLEVSRPLPATLAFDHPTVEALTGYLLKELFPSAEREAGAGAVEKAADLAALSEEEAEALLLAELDALRGGKD